MAIHRFEKGNPGGPGRPRGGHVAWCEDFARTEGEKLLKKWARCNSGKVSMQALTLIYAYGLGKPTERIEHSGNIGNLSQEVLAMRQERGLPE